MGCAAVALPWIWVSPNINDSALLAGHRAIEITEDVMNAEMVSDPVIKLEIAHTSDGDRFGIRAYGQVPERF